MKHAAQSLDRSVRELVYRHFAQYGCAPAPAAIMADTGITRPQLVDAYQRLAAARELVLRSDGTDVLMAHPFSAVSTPFEVRAQNGITYFANCAWDALSISPALRLDSDIRSVCAHTHEPVHLSIRAGTLQGDRPVVHFLVPARDFWRDIEHT